MDRYIKREVKPTLLAAKLHLGAYADGDVIFDWQEITLPGRANYRLVGATAIVRGNDGAAQDCPMDLMFAKKSTTPQSIGTEQGAMLPTANPYYNDIIGGLKLDATDYSDQVQISMGSTTVVESGECPIIFEASATGSNKFYVAATANSGAPNFDSNTAVAFAYGAASASLITLDGTSALLNLAPGDVVHAQDEAVMGTISTVDSATQITLTAANTEAIVDGDLVYNLSPIKLILTFEK